MTRYQRAILFGAIFVIFFFIYALGTAKGADPFAMGVEVGTAPALYESYDEAAAYWAAMPGVPKIEDACGPPPIIYSINTGTASAWGKAKSGDDPCKIWVEDHYMVETAAMLPFKRDLDRCLAIVHEYGHVLGLGHADYGDPSKVMTPQATIPQVCIDSYAPRPEAFAAPLTPYVDPAEEKTVCLPAWAYYGPQEATSAYLNDSPRQARQAFKRWAKRHRREARRMTGWAAVCL
jgi:hypothetical protein